MPIREYCCGRCNHKYENLYTSYSQEKEQEGDLQCPQCGSKEKERLFPTQTSHVLKGRGWARDNYGGRKKR